MKELGDALEAWLLAHEQIDLDATDESAMTEVLGPTGLKGTADCADGAALSEVQQRARNGGKEVSVLVSIEVGDVDAGALKLLDLGQGLALNVVLADLSAEEGLYEVDEAGPEGFSVGTQKSGDAIGMGDGNAVGEDDVAAYAKLRVRAGDVDGIVECRTGSHQRGGGQGVFTM